MKKNSNITMVDIARAVGVSRTTVSFVLNGHAREKGISEAMAEKIHQTAKKLNYRPSLVAQSLITQKTMTIGLVIADMAVSYGPPLVQVIEMGALNQGYQVILCHHGGDMNRLNDILNLMKSRRVEGLIIAAPLKIKQSPNFKEFIDTELPSVFVEHDPDDPRVNYVSASPEQSIKLAMEHLIQLGHKKIALFNASPRLIASQKRLETYKETLNNNGIEFNPSFSLNNDILEVDNEDNRAIYKNILSMTERPTAIVAISAQRAIGAYLAAEELNIKVPENLSIVAITGKEFSDFHKIKFTRVKLSYEAVGEAALRILMEQIKSSKILPKQRILITPELIEDQSSAPKV